MPNLKITVEYDGTEYSGWQYQPDRRTIQGEIENVLFKITQKKIKITGAGRTDAGVHAENQVANFFYNGKMPLQDLKKAMNSLLPSDIFIKNIEKTNDSFNARYDAKSKLYRYKIILGRSPLRRRYAWEYPFSLDFRRMKKALSIFKGRKNYGNFCQVNEENPFIELKRLEIKKIKDEIIMEMEAPRFFYKMVRRIVGALCEIGRGEWEKNDVSLLFLSHEGKRPITAPANGLTLVKVYY